jgi:hypothetical protein
MKIKYLLIGCLVLVAAVALVACQPAPAPAPAETSPPPEQPAQVCPTAEPCRPVRSARRQWSQRCRTRKVGRFAA